MSLTINKKVMVTKQFKWKCEQNPLTQLGSFNFSSHAIRRGVCLTFRERSQALLQGCWIPIPLFNGGLPDTVRFQPRLNCTLLLVADVGCTLRSPPLRVSWQTDSGMQLVRGPLRSVLMPWRHGRWITGHNSQWWLKITANHNSSVLMYKERVAMLSVLMTSFVNQ